MSQRPSRATTSLGEHGIRAKEQNDVMSLMGFPPEQVDCTLRLQRNGRKPAISVQSSENRSQDTALATCRAEDLAGLRGREYCC